MPIPYILRVLFIRLRKIAYSLISPLQRLLRELQKRISPNEQPVSDQPVLDHALQRLRAHGIYQVVNRRGCIHRDLLGEFCATFSQASPSPARSESNYATDLLGHDDQLGWRDLRRNGGVAHTGFAGPGLPHHAGRGTIDDRQNTVVASNISDVRSVLPVMSYTATTGTSFSVNCNEADRVIAHIGAIMASITLTLNNLQVAYLSRLLSQTLRGEL